MHGAGRRRNRCPGPQRDHTGDIGGVSRLCDIPEDNLVELGGGNTLANQELLHRDPAKLTGMDIPQLPPGLDKGCPQTLDDHHRSCAAWRCFPACTQNTAPGEDPMTGSCRQPTTRISRLLNGTLLECRAKSPHWRKFRNSPVLKSEAGKSPSLSPIQSPRNAHRVRRRAS